MVGVGAVVDGPDAEKHKAVGATCDGEKSSRVEVSALVLWCVCGCVWVCAVNRALAVVAIPLYPAVSSFKTALKNPLSPRPKRHKEETPSSPPLQAFPISPILYK